MPTFEQRIHGRLDQMSPAEQRVTRYFQENREEVLIASAAALAVKAKTSDATIVRATRALGFSGLADLRRTLAVELRNSLSPADRLTRTLDQVGGNPSTAFDLTLDIHLQSLANLRRSITPSQFKAAVDGIAKARRILIFGIGPSSAIADYFVVQLGRFGLDAASLTNTGLLFADDLQKLREGDLVIILAYGRIYAELAALLDAVKGLALQSILLTDTLAVNLRHRVDMVLSVPRGHADMLSMHTATLGFVEALLVGIAASRPDETLASLNRLNEARERQAGKRVKLPTAK